MQLTKKAVVFDAAIASASSKSAPLSSATAMRPDGSVSCTSGERFTT